ncbi:surface-adhesin E family protein [Polynucleobacter tropicus]|uniref:surface-adhesin E family protein n=1 Tax=Polynucleobacter tropicus TaxID=1743174 RepID=UPI00156E6DC3|nr:surface-adhesin E family protein [Polynucleobacter tropicus]
MILVGVTAILLNPVTPSYAKWVFLSNDNVGNAYYYDDSKTVNDPGNEQVSTWQLISYAETLTAPNGEPTQSVIQDISYYCRVGYESYKQYYIGYYSGPEGAGVSVDQADTSSSNWERVIPDTMSYVLYKFFCKPPNIPS